MPRYFFYLHANSTTELDSAGSEFASLGDAIADTRQACTEIMEDESRETSRGWYFEIKDEKGRVVATVPFVED